MRLLTLIPYLTLAVASVLEPDLGSSQPRDTDIHKRMAVNREDQVPPLEERSLEKRQCNYNGCECLWVEQDQYCGLCETGSYRTVWYYGDGGNWNHIYECSPDGDCCDYGYARDCAGLEAEMRCGPVMVPVV
ncbi:hypothetical protein DL768_010165 [Monosporascus sp. mg162]|nr:hypothetical protein DL768_010165 [Monosporascus sp. mg162]